MRATSKGARELEQQAANFNHPMLPRKGAAVLKISAAFLADLVERVERLEAQLCQQQKTNENQ